MQKPRLSLQAWLASQAWFGGLPPAAAKTVLRCAYMTFHQRAGLVASIGAPVHSWLGVIEGLCKVQAVLPDGRPVVFTAIPSGSWFGEGSVLCPEPRKYEVVALRDSWVAHVPADIFQWLVNTEIVFAHFVIRQLNARLAQNIALVHMARSRGADKMVATVLCGLFDATLHPTVHTHIEVSQEEIGQLAGVCRQRANDALHGLERLGAVKLMHRGIEVLNLPKLRAICAAP